MEDCTLNLHLSGELLRNYFEFRKLNLRIKFYNFCRLHTCLSIPEYDVFHRQLRCFLSQLFTLRGVAAIRKKSLKASL